MGVSTCRIVICAAFIVGACDSASDGSTGGGQSGGDSQTNAGPGGEGGATAAEGGQGNGSTNSGNPECASSLKVKVRDFKESHPDFQAFLSGLVKGLVKQDLGPDKKPVWASVGDPEKATTGPKEFDQWYRDTPGVNMQIPVEIKFTEERPGVFVYDNKAFFPIDGKGLGNGPAVDSPHNYLFTTEAHTLFTYKGGEEFTFRGDDDLWVFINGKLAVDIGGVHGALMGSVALDASAAKLGIEVGKTYPMDIFHAERHTVESNYRIETTIDLSCIENVIVI